MKALHQLNFALTPLLVLGLAIAQSVKPAAANAANTAPKITNFTLNGSASNITINEGQSVSARISARDPNLTDAITFKIRDLSQPAGVFFYVGTVTTTNKLTRTISTTLNTFIDNGTFGYRARAVDSKGAWNTFTRPYPFDRTIIVNNVAPTLTDFTLSSYEVNEGDALTAFLAATDPGADTISFLVNGNTIGTDNATSGTRSLTSVDVSSLAVDDGDFNITGQARDKDNALSTNSIVKLLKVLNVAPTITSFNFSLLGGLLTVNATATDPGINDLLAYDWDFDGNGTYDDAAGQLGEWKYQRNGLYNVGLRVSDGDGGFAYSSVAVEVTEIPEPSSMAGILAVGALGGGSVLKRKKTARK
jgi:hypothetical protein